MELQELFKNISLELNQTQLNQFNKYTDLLLEWNEKINLTAITNIDEIHLKHYIDSVLPLNLNIFDGDAKVIDVGCGAGFPSLPLKIASPNLSFTLIDSLNKRIQFLNQVISDLKLSNIETVHARAEDAGHDLSLREQFDICVARAVAPYNILLEYCTPFIKVGGTFVALKGKDYNTELASADKALEKLSMELVEVREVEIPTTDLKRYLIIAKKISQTSSNYPRKAGKPSKNPL